MNELAGHIWCASSTNLVQGFLAGVGLLGGGLALFPLETYVSRANTGSAASYARAKESLGSARFLLWALLPIAGTTLAGYLLLYAAADGESCDAAFTPKEQDLVLWWAAGVAASFLILVVLFVLRLRVRHQQMPEQD